MTILSMKKETMTMMREDRCNPTAILLSARIVVIVPINVLWFLEIQKNIASDNAACGFAPAKMTAKNNQPRWLSGSVLRRWLGGLRFEAGSERDFKLLLQSSLSFYRSLGWRGGWMRGKRN